MLSLFLSGTNLANIFLSSSRKIKSKYNTQQVVKAEYLILNY